MGDSFRRNLDNVYKRQLEESERKRIHLELELSTLKNYMILASTKLKGQNTYDFDALITEIESLHQKLLKMSTAHPQASGNMFDKIYSEAIAIADLALDKLPFKPVSTPLQNVISVLHDNITYGTYKSELSETKCLKLDLDSVSTVMRALGRSLSVERITPKSVEITHYESYLFITFTGDFAHMKPVSDTVTRLLSSTVDSSVQITDAVTTLFIARAVTQSMGGDIFFDEGTLQLTTPCEMLDDAECTEMKMEAPHPVTTPVPAPLPRTPTPAPIPIPAPPPPPSPSPRIIPAPIPPPPPPPPPAPVPVPSPIPAPAPPTEQKFTLEGMLLNIMLVEDSITLQKLFTKFWQRKGHNVVVAKNGQEAVDLYKKANYSIVFMDIELPIKDGLEVTQEIRTFEKQSGRPPTIIIGVSGYSDKLYRERALSSGMNDFIYKGSGYQMEEIYQTVERYLGYPAKS